MTLNVINWLKLESMSEVEFGQKAQKGWNSMF